MLGAAGVDVAGHSGNFDLAQNLCHTVTAADFVARDGAADARDFAALAANIGRVRVRLRDDIVVLGRAGVEDILNGAQNLGAGLQLGSIGGLREPAASQYSWLAGRNKLALGWTYFAVERSTKGEELDRALAEAARAKRPAVCDVRMTGNVAVGQLMLCT